MYRLIQKKTVSNNMGPVEQYTARAQVRVTIQQKKDFSPLQEPSPAILNQAACKVEPKWNRNNYLPDIQMTTISFKAGEWGELSFVQLLARNT
jgi:hypothetical protein